MAKLATPRAPRIPAPRLPQAVARAASHQLFHRRAARPVQTLAWAAAAGLAALPVQPTADANRVHLEMDLELWLDALFNDWSISAEPWPKAETKVALPILQQVVMSQHAILPPLPAFPARPTLTPPVLDKLWHHLDLAGWRMDRFLSDGALERHVDREARVLHLLQEGVDLLVQFHLMMQKAYTDHAASAKDYTEELASLLHRLHKALDAAATAAGSDPLNWPVPDYRAFMGEAYPLPAGPRGAALPANLAEDLQKALEARRSTRPLATALPLVQRYAAMKRALMPHWTWSPARDGRECAFILFESGMEELPDWNPAQARELARLCTALYRWSEDLPTPPLPTLELDVHDNLAAALWAHQDLLLLVGSIVAVDLGIMPEFDDARALKRERRLRDQWAEMQSMTWGAIHHWGPASPEDRSLVATLLPIAMGALYQEFRNQIAKVDRGLLSFIPKPPPELAPRARASMVRFSRVKKR